MPLCSCLNLALQNKSFRGQPLVILSEKEIHQCISHFVVQCEKCGKQFKVEEDTSYHFPLLFWTSIPRQTT